MTKGAIQEAKQAQKEQANHSWGTEPYNSNNEIR